MRALQAQPLAISRRPNQRGQTIALGAISLLILALTVFITLNVTHAVRNRIRLQNYADAKAFSVAVQEARALNYFAYTNRAIASAYVAMANMHAYMSEATMLTEADGAGMTVMLEVAAIEWALCFCCCTPFGCAPCCFNHCIDSGIAALRALDFGIQYFGGEFGSAVQALDNPFRQTMTALDAHIEALHVSQNLVRAQLTVLIGTSNGELPTLKYFNLGYTPITDTTSGTLTSLSQFNSLFYTDQDKKKRIMAEVVNATRPGFTWNRKGNLAAVAVLTAPATMQRIRDTAGEGIWAVTQPIGITTGGRSGATDGEFPGQSGGVVLGASDPSPGQDTGNTIASYDYGLLAGQWRHAGGVAPLPFFLGPMGAGEIFTGDTNRHRTNNGVMLFADPHSGADHDMEIDMSKFMEFNIEDEKPFSQPSFFATASGDMRFNDFNRRLVFEVTQTGEINYQVGTNSGMTGNLRLSDHIPAHASAKGMVYYHRIGDWADYPNLFNPYWRAKLEPMTRGEAAAVLMQEDPDTAQVATTIGAMPGGPAATNINP